MEVKPLSDNRFVDAFASSFIGGRTENQDSFGAAAITDGFLLTVCDGMGGGPGGKTASSIAVDTIVAKMTDLDPENTIKNNLIRAIRAAHAAIMAKGEEKPSLRGMGSTCTVVVITQEQAYIAHIGDSRVYQLRGHKKIYRTDDHSMVFELVKKKVLTEEQARLSEQSNIITQALGVTEDLEVEVVEAPYKAGDRFMLCSDGIHGTMPEPDLINLITDKQKTLGSTVSGLVERVNKIGNDKGGHHDNLTVILADCKLASSTQKPRSSQTRGIVIAFAVFAILCLVLFGIKNTTTPQLIDTELSSDSIVNRVDTIFSADDSTKKDTN